MNSAEAVYRFLSGFGIPAYATSSVPANAKYPYLTYGLVINEFDAGETNMDVSLWYYTSTESEPDAKAQELYKAIGYGGVQLPCDDGCVWLKRGSPWCQSLAGDASNQMVKRRYINVTVDFNTTR